jgi:glycosyltransferase involved in cell wall biosynthesis
VHLVRPCIDGRVFFPDPAVQTRRIAVMPHKRPQEFAQVRSILRRRGVLEHWELVELRGLPETAVARELRTAPLFLSFARAEGFGLPAAEAIASGCFVIGYHGRAGREYLRPEHAVVVEDGDVVGFAAAIEEFTCRYETSRDALAHRMCDAATWIRETYSQEHQTADLVDVFGGLEPHGAPAGTVVSGRELRLEPGWQRTARRVAVRVGRRVGR